MAWYNLGKVSINKSTKTLKGEGTRWKDNKVSINAGHIVLLPGSGTVQLYEVGKVISDTEMEIKTEYTGENLTGSTYSIITTVPSSVPDFARRLANQLKYYDDYLTFFGEWVDTDKELEFQMPDGSIKKFPPLTGFVKKTGDTMTGNLITKGYLKSDGGEVNATGNGATASLMVQDKIPQLVSRIGDGKWIRNQLPTDTGKLMVPGDFGLGASPTSAGIAPPYPSNANEATFNGFYSGGGTNSTNYYDKYSPMWTGVRQGGDGSGTVIQYQFGADAKSLAARVRDRNSWSPWYNYMVLNGGGNQVLEGSLVAKNNRIGANPLSATRNGNDYLNLYPQKAGGMDDLGFFQYNSGNVFGGQLYIPRSPVGGREHLLFSGINPLANRVMAFKPTVDKQASYIESQNFNGSVRWRIGSMGDNPNRASISTSTMSASIEQINLIASKGFYLDGNIMMDINGGYEHRFYGFGSNPGTSHTMMFARDSDKTIGFNFRNEGGYVGTLLRIDGKNKIVSVNEKPVMVQGDFGFAGNGISEGLTEAKFKDKCMAYSPSQIFRSSSDPGKFGTIYSPTLYMTTGDTWSTLSVSYLTGNVTVSANNRTATNPVKHNNLWGSSNTTVDGNGFIKKASPIIEVFNSGKFNTNEESEGSFVEKLKEGVYLIKGVLGLHSDKSWGGEDGGFEIPVDKNKLPLIWIDYKVQEDGSILLFTYHRVNKDAPTFAQNNIEGKKDGEPIDIPKGRFVSVRVQMPEDSKFNKMLKSEEEYMAKVDEESSKEYNNDTGVQDEPLIDNDIKLLEFKG